MGGVGQQRAVDVRQRAGRVARQLQDVEPVRRARVGVGVAQAEQREQSERARVLAERLRERGCEAVADDADHGVGVGEVDGPVVVALEDHARELERRDHLAVAQLEAAAQRPDVQRGRVVDEVARGRGAHADGGVRHDARAGRGAQRNRQDRDVRLDRRGPGLGGDGEAELERRGIRGRRDEQLERHLAGGEQRRPQRARGGRVAGDRQVLAHQAGEVRAPGLELAGVGGDAGQPGAHRRRVVQ